MNDTEIRVSRNRCGAQLQTGCENKLITPSAHRKQREISREWKIKLQTNGFLKGAEGAGRAAIKKAETQEAQATQSSVHFPIPWLAKEEENPVAQSLPGAIFEGKTRKATPSLGEKT